MTSILLQLKSFIKANFNIVHITQTIALTLIIQIMQSLTINLIKVFNIIEINKICQNRLQPKTQVIKQFRMNKQNPQILIQINIIIYRIQIFLYQRLMITKNLKKVNNLLFYQHLIYLILNKPLEAHTDIDNMKDIYLSNDFKLNTILHQANFFDDRLGQIINLVDLLKTRNQHQKLVFQVAVAQSNIKFFLEQSLLNAEKSNKQKDDVLQQPKFCLCGKFYSKKNNRASLLNHIIDDHFDGIKEKYEKYKEYIYIYKPFKKKKGFNKSFEQNIENHKIYFKTYFESDLIEQNFSHNISDLTFVENLSSIVEKNNQHKIYFEELEEKLQSLDEEIEKKANIRKRSSSFQNKKENSKYGDQQQKKIKTEQTSLQKGQSNQQQFQQQIDVEYDYQQQQIDVEYDYQQQQIDVEYDYQQQQNSNQQQQANQQIKDPNDELSEMICFLSDPYTSKYYGSIQDSYFQQDFFTNQLQQETIEDWNQIEIEKQFNHDICFTQMEQGQSDNQPQHELTNSSPIEAINDHESKNSDKKLSLDETLKIIQDQTGTVSLLQQEALQQIQSMQQISAHFVFKEYLTFKQAIDEINQQIDNQLQTQLRNNLFTQQFYEKVKNLEISEKIKEYNNFKFTYCDIDNKDMNLQPLLNLENIPQDQFIPKILLQQSIESRGPGTYQCRLIPETIARFLCFKKESSLVLDEIKNPIDYNNVEPESKEYWDFPNYYNNTCLLRALVLPILVNKKSNEWKIFKESGNQGQYGELHDIFHLYDSNLIEVEGKIEYGFPYHKNKQEHISINADDQSIIPLTFTNTAKELPLISLNEQQGLLILKNRNNIHWESDYYNGSKWFTNSLKETDNGWTQYVAIIFGKSIKRISSKPREVPIEMINLDHQIQIQSTISPRDSITSSYFFMTKSAYLWKQNKLLE
ncbi:hypothetical protein ABPG74_006905 [Tetrahymena malaccensis]